MIVVKCTLTERELACVLAGLRTFQQERKRRRGMMPPGVHEIATNCGQFSSLSDEEVDELCAELNSSPVEPPA